MPDARHARAKECRSVASAVRHDRALAVRMTSPLLVGLYDLSSIIVPAECAREVRPLGFAALRALNGRHGVQLPICSAAAAGFGSGGFPLQIRHGLPFNGDGTRARTLAPRKPARRAQSGTVVGTEKDHRESRIDHLARQVGYIQQTALQHVAFGKGSFLGAVRREALVYIDGDGASGIGQTAVAAAGRLGFDGARDTEPTIYPPELEPGPCRQYESMGAEARHLHLHIHGERPASGQNPANIDCTRAPHATIEAPTPGGPAS